MSKGTDNTKGKSPYVKYQKSPYLYKFKTCAHSTWIFEAGVGFRGHVCSVCNNIMKPGRDNEGVRAQAA